MQFKNRGFAPVQRQTEAMLFRLGFTEPGSDTVSQRAHTTGGPEGPCAPPFFDKQ